MQDEQSHHYSYFISFADIIRGSGIWKSWVQIPVSVSTFVNLDKLPNFLGSVPSSENGDNNTYFIMSYGLNGICKGFSFLSFTYSINLVPIPFSVLLY